ncbi:F-box protein FBW2-like [Mercurialis annua]|uniref:F-box protein FBW2-like n=1 Tax=Mercurialis annua TaxID=3986 RepID=UPI002160FF64|nr:F-box protein FBW2-like [Mercurialis annua]
MATLSSPKRNGSLTTAASARWEELNPEILALILVRIPAEERVGHVSLVCKSWLACVYGPYCWSEIDIQQWCRRQFRSADRVDSAVRKLIKRSRGAFRLLSAHKLGDAGFAFAANCGKYLKVLQIPMSEVTDKIVEKHAASLLHLTVLDITYCLKITSKGIEALGKNCKSLIHLRRNMPPPEWERPAQGNASRSNDIEAMAIANIMPGLQHLELGFGTFGDSGLDAILTECKALSHLDIRGCWNVRLEGDLEDRCTKLRFFNGPWIDDYGSSNDSDGEYPSTDSESD